MLKFWKISNSKSNRLILIKEKSIFKGNPSESIVNKLNSETTDFNFTKDMFSIPYSYIKKIENQHGNKELKIFYGQNSEEELILEREETKNEIFEYIKSDIQDFNYSTELPNLFKFAKGQFFALLITTVIFIWSLYLAIEIENGSQYEVVGGRPGLAGIVLMIANLGIIKITIGYAVLLGIILLGLVKRLRSRTETQTLKRGKY